MTYNTTASDTVDEIKETVFPEKFFELLEEHDEIFNSLEELKNYLECNADLSEWVDDAVRNNDVEFDEEEIISDYGISDAISEFTDTDANEVAKSIIRQEWDNNGDYLRDILDDFLDSDEFESRKEEFLGETPSTEDNDLKVLGALKDLYSAIETLRETCPNSNTIIHSLGECLYGQIEKETAGRIKERFDKWLETLNETETPEEEKSSSEEN